MVSAFVEKSTGSALGRNASSSTSGLQARCTTLMPYQWTLALPLLGCMFSPSVEVRTNRRKTKVLGVRFEGTASEIDLDQFVGHEDLRILNEIRAALTTGLSNCLSASTKTRPGNVDRLHPYVLSSQTLLLLEKKRGDFLPRKRYHDHPVASVGNPHLSKTTGIAATQLMPIEAGLHVATLEEERGEDPNGCSDEDVGQSRRQEVSRLWERAIRGGRDLQSCCVCGWTGKNMLNHLRNKRHQEKEEDYIRSG